MTEQEWQGCSDPDRMLAYLEGSASKRKLDLLCCACCRRLWRLLETDVLREAVNAFERFADGEIDEEAYRAAALTTHPFRNYHKEMLSTPREGVIWTAYAVTFAMYGRHGQECRKALGLFAHAARPHEEEECAAHVQLIREVFGNPFRPAAVQPAWMWWGEGLIVKLAAALYDERSLPAGTLDAERLSILADALEEAGCADAKLLGHLRSPGPHVRGCWVVDLILGKR